MLPGAEQLERDEGEPLDMMLGEGGSVILAVDGCIPAAPSTIVVLMIVSRAEGLVRS